MIIHFTPYPWVTSELLKDDKSIVFENDMWRVGAEKPKSLGFSDWWNSDKILGLSCSTSEMLAGATPMWSRFFPEISQLDNHLQFLATKVSKLSSDLIALEVKAAIQYSGSPHHPSTLIFHIACQILGVPVIYLYEEPVSRRILPVEFCFPNQGTVTPNGLKPLRVKVSNFDPSDDIGVYSRRARAGKPTRDLERGTRQSSKSMIVGAMLLMCAHGHWASLEFFARLGCSSRKDRLRAGTYDRSILLSPYRRKGVSVGDEIRVMEVQKVAIKILEDFIRQDSKSAKPGRKLVFFGHFQPESSTFPEQGPTLHNHLHAIRLLRASGWAERIIFREHPMNFRTSDGFTSTRVGVARSAAFYQTLRDLGCEFSNPFQNFEEEEEDIVVTVAGSVGLERAFRGLPTVVLGSPWYQGLPGIVSVSEGYDFVAVYGALKTSGVSLGDVESFITTLLSGTTLERPVKVLGKSKKAEPEIEALFLSQLRQLASTLSED